jgi:hypothetical protein
LEVKQPEYMTSYVSHSLHGAYSRTREIAIQLFAGRTVLGASHSGGKAAELRKDP